MWGFTAPLGILFRRWDFTRTVVTVCVALYVLSLLIDPSGLLRGRDPFSLLSPTGSALDALGMTGASAWRRGRWWTLLTAIYLHGGALHILFNMLWIRQLGPGVEEIYGPARLTVIFTVAGAAGSLASILWGISFTIGASGSVFGLLGALVAFGRKRGGTFGRMVLRQYGTWALAMFVLSFFMPGVNNIGHAGGFVGGFLTGLVLSPAERQAERGGAWLTALACVALTLLSFALALWTAFVR